MSLPGTFSELVQCCDLANNPLPERITRQQALEQGIPFRIAVAWLVDPVHKTLLLQRRSSTKIFSPGKIDASASGAVLYQEDEAEATLREIEEELHVRPTKEALSFLGITSRSRTLEYDGVALHSIAFDYHYLIMVQAAWIQTIRADPEEIDQLLWIPLSDLQNWLHQPENICSSKIDPFLKLAQNHPELSVLLQT